MEESPKLNTPNEEFIYSNNICDRRQDADDCALQQSDVNCVPRGFKWFETLSRDAAWKSVFAFLAYDVLSASRRYCL
jgi:hypothetical protein